MILYGVKSLFSVQALYIDWPITILKYMCIVIIKDIIDYTGLYYNYKESHTHRERDRDTIIRGYSSLSVNIKYT